MAKQRKALLTLWDDHTVTHNPWWLPGYEEEYALVSPLGWEWDSFPGDRVEVTIRMAQLPKPPAKPKEYNTVDLDKVKKLRHSHILNEAGF
jgi:hypothetical protein